MARPPPGPFVIDPAGPRAHRVPHPDEYPASTGLRIRSSPTRVPACCPPPPLGSTDSLAYISGQTPATRSRAVCLPARSTWGRDSLARDVLRHLGGGDLRPGGRIAARAEHLAHAARHGGFRCWSRGTSRTTAVTSRAAAYMITSARRGGTRSRPTPRPGLLTGTPCDQPWFELTSASGKPLKHDLSERAGAGAAARKA